MLLPDKGPVGQELPDQNQGPKNVCDSKFFFQRGIGCLVHSEVVYIKLIYLICILHLLSQELFTPLIYLVVPVIIFVYINMYELPPILPHPGILESFQVFDRFLLTQNHTIAVAPNTTETQVRKINFKESI